MSDYSPLFPRSRSSATYGSTKVAAWSPAQAALPSRTRQIIIVRFWHQADQLYSSLEFAAGQIVLLTRLCEGQHATVLQLPARPLVTTDEVRKHDLPAV